MSYYIANAFSLNMLANLPASVKVKEVSLEQAVALAHESGWTSLVGHADTAAIFTSVLGVTVPANRVTVRLEKGDKLLVGQYRGPRLEEGTTRLPDGATIQWLAVVLA